MAAKAPVFDMFFGCVRRQQLPDTPRVFPPCSTFFWWKTKTHLIPVGKTTVND
jgi:hypothetical protein